MMRNNEAFTRYNEAFIRYHEAFMGGYASCLRKVMITADES